MRFREVESAVGGHTALIEDPNDHLPSHYVLVTRHDSQKGLTKAGSLLPGCGGGPGTRAEPHIQIIRCPSCALVERQLDYCPLPGPLCFSLTVSRQWYGLVSSFDFLKLKIRLSWGLLFTYLPSAVISLQPMSLSLLTVISSGNQELHSRGDLEGPGALGQDARPLARRASLTRWDGHSPGNLSSQAFVGLAAHVMRPSGGVVVKALMRWGERQGLRWYWPVEWRGSRTGFPEE